MNKISLFQLVFLTVGAMVGSAVFSLSGVTIMQAGDLAVLSWAFAGLLLLGFGFVTTNLLNAVEISNGDIKLHDFPALAFKSNFLGYITSWIYLFGCTAGVSFSAIYFAHYLVNVFPVLLPIVHILPTLSVLIIYILNLLKIGQLTRINTVLTILLVLILILIAFVLCLHSNSSSHDVNIFPTSSNNLLDMLSQIPISMLAYGAIVVPAFMASSVVNPKKNVRLGMFIAMILTTTIYCVVIFATLRFINAQYLIEHHESVFSPITAALDVAELPNSFTLLVNFAAVLALFTTMLVVGKLGVSSVENIFPKQESKARFSTEKLSSGLFFAVVFIVTLFYTKVQLVIDSGALFNALFTLIICASGFQLTKTKSHKILALFIAVVISITYIPTLVNANTALYITTIIYLVLGYAIWCIRKRIK
ncbi:MAG: amino acid permease [Candidatus Ancillula sp.]|jgi:amino acid transporter|nr:amino acid permease [Candidatus Ancillula sp.]